MAVTFYDNKRVCVTGSLGSHAVEELERRGASDIFVPRSKDYDLRHAIGISRMLADSKPDLIIHLAAMVGGIGANMANPGRRWAGGCASSPSTSFPSCST